MNLIGTNNSEHFVVKKAMFRTDFYFNWGELNSSIYFKGLRYTACRVINQMNLKKLESILYGMRSTEPRHTVCHENDHLNNSIGGIKYDKIHH